MTVSVTSVAITSRAPPDDLTIADRFQSPDSGRWLPSPVFCPHRAGTVAAAACSLSAARVRPSPASRNDATAAASRPERRKRNYKKMTKAIAPPLRNRSTAGRNFALCLGRNHRHRETSRPPEPRNPTQSDNQQTGVSQPVFRQSRRRFASTRYR